MAHCKPYTAKRYAWPDDAATLRYTLERVRANVAFVNARRGNVAWKDSLVAFQRQGERLIAGMQTLLTRFAANSPPSHKDVCGQVCRANSWLARMTLIVSSPLIQKSFQSPFSGNRATTNPELEESACE